MGGMGLILLLTKGVKRSRGVEKCKSKSKCKSNRRSFDFAGRKVRDLLRSG
jgi:hypothetical protein